jgi:putative salt-induced outer membrane protein YdiY
MKGTSTRLAFALAILVLFAPRARAADGDAAPKPIQATVNAGYVQTGGNTDVVTMLGSDTFKWKTGAWQFSQDGKAVYGRTDGTENAGQYGFGLRADYTFTPRVSLYALTTWQRNVFAGIVHQYDEGAGLVYHAIQPKPQLLDLELGLGALQRRNTLPENENFSTARAGARYKYSFAEKSYFEVYGDWVADLENTKNNDIEGRAAVAAPLAGALSLNLGYNAQYRSQPLPGLEKLDWTISAGLQFTY